MKFLGEFTPGKTVVLKFNTHKADGTPITLAGTPAVSVYKDSTTESTTGVTLSVDYDSRTGMHRVAIDTSADGTFYAAGNDFDVVITTGTVDSVSVVGTVVGTFSLSNRAGLRPTTADRTLDVSSGGEAGIDWANVGSPTTTVALSNTTVSTVTTLTNLPTIPNDWITAAGLAADAGTEIGTAVWSSASRILTAATNITSTGGTTVPQTGDTYAIANSGTHGNAALKTLIDTVDTVVDAILADTGTDGVAISSSVRESIGTSILDLAAGVENNRTLRQALRLILASAAGKLSGAATTTVTIRDTNDGVNRIVATVDSDGNRSAVTLDAS